MKPSPTTRSTLSRPSTWLRIALLLVSAWMLHREFSGVEPAALVRQFGSYGPTHLSLAIGATIASFLLLGGIEILALRSAGISREAIPSPLALGTAFVAHAVSQSVGLAILTGAAVRIRAYARRGIGTAQAAQVSTLVTLGITLGLLASAAWVFMASRLPLHIAGYTIMMRPLGILLGIVVLAYLVWSAAGPSGVKSAQAWRIPRPPPTIAAGLLALATLDWIVTGIVLFAFMPPDAHIHALAFLSAYITAQAVAVVSHVPAGAGVFEVTLLGLLLATSNPTVRPALLAAIIMYRAIYYLAPFCLAVAVASIVELRRARNPAGASTLPPARRPLAESRT